MTISMVSNADVLARASARRRRRLSRLPGSIVRGPFDLLGFAGQTIVLRFRAATNISLVTTFRIDDMSVR
jgi:hypothetical protein